MRIVANFSKKNICLLGHVNQMQHPYYGEYQSPIVVAQMLYDQSNRDVLVKKKGSKVMIHCVCPHQKSVKSIHQTVGYLLFMNI